MKKFYLVLPLLLTVGFAQAGKAKHDDSKRKPSSPKKHEEAASAAKRSPKSKGSPRSKTWATLPASVARLALAAYDGTKAGEADADAQSVEWRSMGKAKEPFVPSKNLVAVKPRSQRALSFDGVRQVLTKRFSRRGGAYPTPSPELFKESGDAGAAVESENEDPFLG